MAHLLLCCWHLAFKLLSSFSYPLGAFSSKMKVLESGKKKVLRIWEEDENKMAV